MGAAPGPLAGTLTRGGFGRRAAAAAAYRLDQLRTGAHDAADHAAHAALSRLNPGRTVMLSEYALNPHHRFGWDRPAHAGLKANLAAGEARYAEVIDGLAVCDPWYRSIATDPDGSQPGWGNPYWGGVDAMVQCAALVHSDPATYLEVGAGHSTRFARRAITDFDLRTRIVSVDPAPRVEVETLSDELVRAPFERVLDSLPELRSGDVVLLDGSHTAFMGSDTVAMMFEFLPTIPPGVMVGIDDIFLPWDYPPTWDRRWYGEQYLLASFLLGGAAGWEVVFPGWYVTHESSLSDRLDPYWGHVHAFGGRGCTSFWMRRTIPNADRVND